MQSVSASKGGSAASCQIEKEARKLLGTDINAESAAVVVNALSAIGDEVNNLISTQLRLVAIVGDLNRRLDTQRSIIRVLSAKIRHFERQSNKSPSVH